MPRSIFIAIALLLGAGCKSEASDATSKGPPEPTKAKADAKTAPADAKAADTKASDTKAPEAEPGARTWTFDDATAGTVPAGIRITESGGQGSPATWAVVADEGAPTQPHAFGITESLNDKRTYNLAFMEGTRYADVDITVMVRAISGKLNQGGGPIWRVADAENYYIARWDPVEDNAYLYIMQGGTRTALAKTDLKLDHDAWHSLRVVMEGAHIELFIDDEPVLEADDTSLTEPGMIGLWTKSDGATLFDDLSVAEP